MAGSIISRNRGIILRTASPLAIGTVAAWTLLPVTMRNVSDLAWEYEKRVPAVAEQHLRVRSLAEESWKQTVDGGEFARDWMESKIGQGRETLEEWVRKGR
jgi:organizing structure protein 2